MNIAGYFIFDLYFRYENKLQEDFAEIEHLKLQLKLNELEYSKLQNDIDLLKQSHAAEITQLKDQYAQLQSKTSELSERSPSKIAVESIESSSSYSSNNLLSMNYVHSQSMKQNTSLKNIENKLLQLNLSLLRRSAVGVDGGREDPRPESTDLTWTDRSLITPTPPAPAPPPQGSTLIPTGVESPVGHNPLNDSVDSAAAVDISKPSPSKASSLFTGKYAEFGRTDGPGANASNAGKLSRVQSMGVNPSSPLISPFNKKELRHCVTFVDLNNPV